MLGDPAKPGDNPILTSELEKEINDKRAAMSSTSVAITLDRKTRFFSGGHKGGESHNPFIYDWLKDIPNGKDLLSGKQADVADAIGGRKVSTKPGEKEYKQALFEKRAGVLLPASKWVEYAEKMFKWAMTRSSDTPDDPTTPGVNEATKTGLKKET